MGERARGWFALVLLTLLVACSRTPEVKVTRTLQVSAETFAEIRRNPHVRLYSRETVPSARLAGLDGNPLPPGVMLYAVVNDPYLSDLGFTPEVMIMEINGRKAHDIFIGRWQRKTLRRPAGLHGDHYKDLIDYLFIENAWSEVVMKVYLDVPGDVSQASSYVPKVENWLIRIDRGTGSGAGRS